MIRIEKSVVINRPVQEVWDFVTDLRNSPRWTRSGSELRQISDGPPGVGATIESRRRFFGRFEIKSQSIVVTEYEPNHSVAYVAKVPLLGRAVERLSFEPTEGGTRLTRSTEVEVGGALRWLQPTLPRLIGSIHTTELASLKRLIEAGGWPVSSLSDNAGAVDPTLTAAGWDRLASAGRKEELEHREFSQQARGIGAPTNRRLVARAIVQGSAMASRPGPSLPYCPRTAIRRGSSAGGGLFSRARQAYGADGAVHDL